MKREQETRKMGWKDNTKESKRRLISELNIIAEDLELFGFLVIGKS